MTKESAIHENVYTNQKIDGSMMLRPILNNNVFWCNSVIVPHDVSSITNMTGYIFLSKKSICRLTGDIYLAFPAKPLLYSISTYYWSMKSYFSVSK